jgi:hypothetical protein
VFTLGLCVDGCCFDDRCPDVDESSATADNMDIGCDLMTYMFWIKVKQCGLFCLILWEL